MTKIIISGFWSSSRKFDMVINDGSFECVCLEHTSQKRWQTPLKMKERQGFFHLLGHSFFHFLFSALRLGFSLRLSFMPWNGARRRTFEGHSSLPDVSQEDLVHIQLAGFLVSAASRVQEFQGFGDQFLFLKAMDDLLFHRASLTGKTDSYMFDIPDMNREDEGDIFSFFLLWPGIGNETK